MKGKKLVIITIDKDDASEVYVRNKLLACNRVGLEGVNLSFYTEDYKRPENLGKYVIDTIKELNDDKNVVGIMIQKPYPIELDDYALENQICPYKDVDGLSTKNLISTLLGKEPIHYPATPKGIITLLDHYNIPIEGKNVVIIGRSDIVGKPLAAMMTARNATVTLCHSKTPEGMLWYYMSNADIIVSAVGKPHFIKSGHIIKGYKVENFESIENAETLYNNPVIIDVGINRDENGKLCGDVDFNDVAPHCKAITPVPGGVGKMTVYSLIENCCRNV